MYPVFNLPQIHLGTGCGSLFGAAAFKTWNNCVTFSETNLALNKPAYQSSTYKRPGSGRAFPASLAVDGNRDTNFQHGSCSHTNHHDPLPWLVVDLGHKYKINRVAVTNRGDWGGELKGCFVLLFSIRFILLLWSELFVSCSEQTVRSWCEGWKCVPWS